MERADRKVTGAAPRPVIAILGDIGRNLVKNPLVVGLVAGALVQALGLTLPVPMKTVVDQLAGMAAPAALISIGMALDRYGVRGNLGLASLTSLLKLAVFPAVVLLACRVLGIDPVWTQALVLTAAVPTGVNAWLIANHFNIGHGLASSTITLTTAFGVVSVSAWAYLLL